MTAVLVLIVLLATCVTRASAEVVYLPTTVGLAADRSTALSCESNLRQISYAARAWRSTHGQFPDSFQTLTNELASPALLCCPADHSDVCPESFEQMNWSRIDYQWLQGFNPNDEQSVFAQCRIHNNVARISGAVERWQDFRDGWPEVVAQPMLASATPGETVRFEVRLAPTTLQPVQYHWERVEVVWTTNVTFAEDESYPGGGFWHTNRTSAALGTAIGGANGSTLSIAAVTTSDGGLYRVSISNIMGVALSSTARLTVTSNVANPRSDAAAAGRSCIINLRGIGLAARIWGEDRQRLPASFAELTNRHGSSVLGWPLILYCPADSQRTPPAEWSGVNFDDASYELAQPPPSLDDPHANLCRCKVHAFYVEVGGTVVTSNGPPIITTQPRNATAFPGNYSGLWVGVAGPGPFTYRWRKDGVDTTDASEAMYNIDEVQPRHAGTYHVVVSNAFGTTVSSNALLTVAAPLILRDLRSTSNGSVEFTVLGIAGESFVMESSADLLSWIPIRTNVIPASASMQLIDPTPGERRFYRARAR